MLGGEEVHFACDPSTSKTSAADNEDLASRRHPDDGEVEDMQDMMLTSPNEALLFTHTATVSPVPVWAAGLVPDRVTDAPF